MSSVPSRHDLEVDDLREDGLAADRVGTQPGADQLTLGGVAQRSTGPPSGRGAGVARGERAPGDANPGATFVHAARGRLGLHLGLVGGLLLMSVLTWWHVWITGHPTSTLTCQCGDPSEELGYLAWTPWAIAHLHNPFLSNAIYAGQGGVNMLANTSWIAFAALFAPVTWVFGPVATFNVGVTLAPVLSGWCFFFAVRKVTRFVPGQIVGAALYGFSPVIVTSDPIGHFFLIWAFFPPLVFWCLYDLFVDQRHRPALVGLLLGLLTVLQFFTGTELLAMTVVVTVVATVFALALSPRVAWRRRRAILVGLATAAVTAGVLLAYPVWFALDGPRRVVGLAWPGTPGFGAPLSSVVTAGAGVSHTSGLGELSGYFGPSGPTVTYLGAGLLIFLGASVFVWRRSRTAWVLFAAGTVAWSFTLGPRLVPRSPFSDGIPLPFRAIWHIPPLGQIIPVRFAAVAVFAAAMLLAVSADLWWSWGRQILAARHRPAYESHIPIATRFAWGALVSAICTVTVLPIAASYRLPYTVHNEAVPRWFRDVAPNLHDNSVVLTYPYPSSGLPQAMGWQADDALSFRLVSGYAIVPGRDGRHSAAISPFSGSEAVLDTLSFSLVSGLPQAAPATLAMLRRTLQTRGVNVVVVTDVGRDPLYAAGYFTALTGRLPRVQDGAWVWYGLGTSGPLHIRSDAVANCRGSVGSASNALAVPTCVMRSAT